MSDKKWKLHGLEKALAAIPVEERAEVARELETLFKDFDPENAPGEPVLPLPTGTRTCPTCGGELVELTAIPRGTGPDPSAPPLLLLDCETCEIGYCQPLEEDVQ